MLARDVFVPGDGPGAGGTAERDELTVWQSSAPAVLATFPLSDEVRQQISRLSRESRIKRPFLNNAHASTWDKRPRLSKLHRLAQISQTNTF
jgi:hypothetical protein